MHGMPLAALLNLDNLAYQKNEISEDTQHYWDKLKNLAIPGAKFYTQHLLYFGVRDVEQEEVNILNDLRVKNYSVEETRTLGVINAVREALERMHDCDHIYVSFDVDSMDSDLISVGTGTPVPKGYEVKEIKELLTEIIKSEKVVCLEVVEVNPLLDNKGNKMAEVAFDIVEEIAEEL